TVSTIKDNVTKNVTSFLLRKIENVPKINIIIVISRFGKIIPNETTIKIKTKKLVNMKNLFISQTTSM
ncbi:MAG: hypothetical protein J7K23_00015, partial [Thermoproteales archaeon]|nr:hypothetical protein [Thermoproteales archaeon]